MVPVRRPWLGLQPPMMTSAWRMFLTLIQSRRWPGWSAETSGRICQHVPGKRDVVGSKRYVFGPNALINANYNGFKVVWTASVVPSYSAIPSP
jgi:hypothetical protein